MSPWEGELEVARAAALEAGDVIARHATGDRASWEKSDDNPVTAADLEANAKIVGLLRREFPGDAILSEETRDREDRGRFERVWIVDPLDGTKEFIQRIPEFAVSVALAVGGAPVVGVVVQPLSRECFTAARGAGACLNGAPIRVSEVGDLSRSVVLSSRTEMGRGQMDRYDGWFAELRPVGSVALKLAWIAAGRGDLWISEAPKSEWDVCAGDLLVREAGGIFVAFPGGPRCYNQCDVLLHPTLAAGPEPLVSELARRLGA